VWKYRSYLSVAVAKVLVGGSVLAVESAVPAIAQADDTDTGNGKSVDEIVVRGNEPKSLSDSLSFKLTEPLRDIPQSIASISAKSMNDRNLTSLNDALRTIPSITLGAGEFSWQGNNPTIRGFNARDDMYLDGIRDFGSYARDPFNLQSVEVLLGPSSMLFGRGSTGGAINQVTKQPSADPISNVNINAGSDATYRVTADLSRPVSLFNDDGAFRVNFLAHDGKLADRDGQESRSFGVAPSLALGLGSATRLTLSYLGQTSDDRPDYGLPWLYGKPAPVPRHNFYGFDSDYLDTDASILTAQVSHEYAGSARLNTKIRYADYSRRSRITEPLIPDPGPPDAPLSDLSVYRYVFVGQSDETMLAGQADLDFDFESHSILHSVATGIELSRETSNPTFSFAIDVPGTDLLDPDPGQPFTASSIEPRVAADTTGDTLAAYVVDTMKFDESWQFVAGLRWDRFAADYNAVRYAGTPTPFNSGTTSGDESYDRVDSALSYRAGLVYKPSEAATLYVAGSNSFNPSAQSLSFLTSGRGLGLANVDLRPEKNRSLEVGAKAGVRDESIDLGAALFEIQKTNARVPDPDNPGFNMLGGEQTVRGLSLDLSGLVASRFYLSAGYTYLDGEVTRAAPGVAPGAPLTNTPEHSFSFWADYQLTDRFDFGLGGRYTSGQVAQDGALPKTVPGYWLLDAMARYRLSETCVLKLDFSNLTDEYYFEQLHPWHVIPGPGFTATMAVNLAFDPEK
jgi:catecholate siderophore receptor